MRDNTYEKRYVRNHLDDSDIVLVEQYLTEKLGVPIQLTNRDPKEPIARVRRLTTPGATEFTVSFDAGRRPRIKNAYLDRAEFVRWMDARSPRWDRMFRNRPWRPPEDPEDTPEPAIKLSQRPSEKLYRAAVQLAREDNDASLGMLMIYFRINKPRAQAIIERMQAEGVINFAGNILPFDKTRFYT